MSCLTLTESMQTPMMKQTKIGMYTVLELFAGAGGLAVGMEKAGLKCVALNEIDKWACNTLRKNRPNWNVLEGDIKSFSFTEYENKVDIVTGGFPCQAFSYAGKN
jgi:DNA (cytosine-5)-methyltransferase 1